jgi:hypothetical protein
MIYIQYGSSTPKKAIAVFPPLYNAPKKKLRAKNKKSPCQGFSTPSGTG